MKGWPGMAPPSPVPVARAGTRSKGSLTSRDPGHWSSQGRTSTKLIREGAKIKVADPDPVGSGMFCR